MCQRWFVKFHAGDFSLDDALQSGGPIEVDSGQTKTLIENNQHYTMREIADILKISKSIKLLVKRKMCLLLCGKKYGLFGQTNTFALVLLNPGIHLPQQGARWRCQD